ncbi:MAG: hypothetical protein ACLU4J_09285 [Butyricimonas paravirosa]
METCRLQIWGGTYEKPVAFQRYVSDMQEKSLISYFARLEYDFRKIHAVRQFSAGWKFTFGADNRWELFPR